MKIEPFVLERWMTAHELSATHDIAESGILPLSTNDLISFEEPEEREALLERSARDPARLQRRVRVAGAQDHARRHLPRLRPREHPGHDGRHRGQLPAVQRAARAGDHVVAVNPAYQQLNSVPRAVGADVSLWRIGPEGYRYDLDELERLITPRTRLIVVNTPHNPTGAMLERGGARARLRPGRVGRGEAALRRGLPLAGGPRRRPLRAARLRLRSLRHQRRHRLQALRVAGAADRVDGGAGRR